MVQGITVICSKRGGDLSTASHCEWLLTVPVNPDAIRFSFIPITSLLKRVPGKGFLSHAINLYLRCKLFHFEGKNETANFHGRRGAGVQLNDDILCIIMQQISHP